MKRQSQCILCESHTEGRPTKQYATGVWKMEVMRDFDVIVFLPQVSTPKLGMGPGSN
jgi:hypothetical protein